MLPDVVARLLAKIRRAVPPQSSGDDPRVPDLDALAATRDHRSVPALLPLLVANDALRPQVAATIATLLEHVTPSQLYWLDVEARRFHSIEFDDRAWFDLWPADGPHLCRAIAPQWAAVGMLASHPNGHIREYAVRELGHSIGGVEIPYLTIRVNDWVDEVAETAASLLARRLARANRAAVLAALPFIVRMLDQRRRDHRRLQNAFVAVLTSGDCGDVVDALDGSDRTISRALFTLLLEHAPSRRIVDAALAAADPITRNRAIARLVDVESGVALSDRLAQLTRSDRAPAVRKTALSLLATVDPAATRTLWRDTLFDGSARVRSLAQFLARRLEPSLDMRLLYLAHLHSGSARLRAAAVEGLWQTGTADDADAIAGLLDAAEACVRVAALRALAHHDINRAFGPARAALEDRSGSVRTAARRILENHLYRLDFSVLARRMPAVADVRARAGMLTLLAEAPKWDAAVYLLEAVGDEDAVVRHRASELLASWIALYNTRQTAPTREHLVQIGALLDAHESLLDTGTADFIRRLTKEP